VRENVEFKVIYFIYVHIFSQKTRDDETTSSLIFQLLIYILVVNWTGTTMA